MGFVNVFVQSQGSKTFTNEYGSRPRAKASILKSFFASRETGRHPLLLWMIVVGVDVVFRR